MTSISLPQKLNYEKTGDNQGVVVIEGFYPGYGTTIGNALRRTLLSSLPGSAIVSIKVKGLTHEFTTIKGMKEDIVQVILNLKKVRFLLNSVEEATVFLSVKGEKTVTAKDFKTTAEVEVVNPEQEIANLTAKNAELEMEVKIEKGIGYLPVEQQQREEKEIGTIAVDAIYNPVKRVNFSVENMRVGKRTDYDRVTLEITTDGSIEPDEAYRQALEIIKKQFETIADLKNSAELEEEVEEVEEAADQHADELNDEVNNDSQEENLQETKVGDLDLSTRTLNVLEENGIKKVSDISSKTEAELDAFDGMGEKGIKEIKKAIGSLGIILKSEE